jgi:hypothetical protein
MRLIPFALALVLVPALARAGEVPVTFKGRKFTPEEILRELTPAQKQAVWLYSDWAAKAEYRMDFDAQGKLLLVTPKDSSRSTTALKVVAKTQTWFDTMLPPPERAAVAKPEAEAPKKPANAPIPEDPESAPAGGPAPKTDAEPQSPMEAAKTWGRGSIPPDTQTAVMIILRDEKDHSTLLDSLGQNQSYLKSWLDTARQHTGFAIEEPLCGAYIENAEGQEEWNPDHELVNRVAQLMTLRRFGQQSNWIVQGIAWDAEMAYDGSIYCFPYRKEFVFATEHTGWPIELKALFKDRASKPLELIEVAHWKRATWDATAARLSWALVHQLFLMAPPGKLSSALEELRRYRDEKDRRVTKSTSWERIPGWDVPIEQQIQTMTAHFGPKFLETASTAIRTGKDVKAAKPASGEKNGVRAK